MTPREYLMSLNPPLAKAGRGRFSREAKAALEAAIKSGMVFDEPVKATAPVARPRPAPKPDLWTTEGEPALPPEPEPVVYKPRIDRIVRNVESLWAEDPEFGKTEFFTCRNCSMHVKFCKCPEIGLPHGCTHLIDSPN